MWVLYAIARLIDIQNDQSFEILIYISKKTAVCNIFRPASSSIEIYLLTLKVSLCLQKRPRWSGWQRPRLMRPVQETALH